MDHALCAVGGLVESGAVLAAANKISVGMTHFPHLWLVSWWVMAQHSWWLPCCGFRHLPNAFLLDLNRKGIWVYAHPSSCDMQLV